MFIVIKPEGYQVYVNGNEHYLFKHRIPLEKVSAITISGHVILNLFAFVQKWSTSIFATQVKRGFLSWTPSTIHSQLSLPIQTPALPYVGPISGGLKAGLALYLQGVVGSKGPGFFINFKTGQSEKDDTAFQFNPRHNSDVVMNSCESGGLGAEEFGPDNPFKAGEAFEMFIVIKPEGYQVHVNGKECYLFNHRIPLEKVSALQIQGDLVVKLLGFIKNWNKLSFLRWGLSTIQSEFSLPVQNPALPYVRPIPEGLKAGLALYFQGVAGTTGDKFGINFKTGQSDKDDYAFHFNPRFNSNVFMNTRTNGVWGAEEFGPDNPFKIGEAFDMFIVIKPEGYQVYVNGNEHYLFKHRIPLEKVSAITISGHVILNLFAFVQKWSTSIFATQVKRGFLSWTPSTIHSQLSLPIQTPALPYVGPISGGLKAGLALYLQGVVGSKGPGFFINFKTGQSEKDDTAFQFNPRHNSDVVMNSCESGGLGAEEFGPDNPFKAGEAFEMFIVIKPEGYQVHVNGKEYYLFNHRIPLEKVSALQIQGDLVVKLLGFIKNWNKLSFLRWGLSTIQSEFSLPVQNPALPYVRPIPEGLKAGLALYFQGVAGTTGDKFGINFKTGQSDKDDYAFHFNPRFNSNVFMNTRTNGVWGAEEFGPDNPFKIGEAFDMFIVIKPEGYQVYVNGNEHYLFKHRIPLEKVSAITISGHVILNLFAFVQKWSTSIFATQVKRGFLSWTPSTIHSQLSLPIQTPALPYVGPISGGLKAGLALYLQGVVGSKGPGFFINFKTGQSEKDDTAFQFNPRHNSDVVMNSCESGGLGAEEFGPDNPFKAGEAFEMFIVIKPEGYQVHVNGKECYLFNHRIPLEKVSALQIQGDLVVKLLGFIKNWNRLSFLRWGLSTIQSEFSLPVQNPSLPYVRPIPEGLKAGLALYFQGVAGTTGDRFEINFKTGLSDKDDHAFHFNPQYNSNVFMNTRTNGVWGAEEFGPDNPFKIGEAFDMFIVIKPEGYQVYVNGNEHYLFKHRIPLEKVSAITIVGHVILNLFAFVQKWSTSSFATQLSSSLRWSSSTSQLQLSFPVQNPALPYVGPISGGLKAGVALYLQGVVGSKGPGFSVTFKTGQSDKDDTAFHFNVRYNSNVAMNSCKNAKWEAEEFAADNPFKMGEAFEMCIVIKIEGFQVYVNSNEIYLFKHRIPLEKISVLNISGDVVMNLCDLIQDWSTSSLGRKFFSLGSSQFEIRSFQSDLLLPVQNPKIPYIGPISGGVKPGMSFFLQGVVASNAKMIVINFLTGPSENNDIAFHFNPRLDLKVAMNTRKNGKWQNEEQGSISCFKKGQAFELLIFFTPHGYKVHVNGQELYMFKERITLDKVAALAISGDVSVGIFGFMMEKAGISVSPPTFHYTHGDMGGACIRPSGHHRGHHHGHDRGQHHGHERGQHHGHERGHHTQRGPPSHAQKHCQRK
ncbi:uncharacterized protein LOC130435700 [Triplophysa dalaica]|uniref:uncharacterized protein LOC130435700 n=1 Tax=Triplophysa dalaica TaxID=1582913 RepID=UPI0024DFA31C|nr:uncharacterized protein LOC130435700 [Triplophysa dalaica]